MTITITTLITPITMPMLMLTGMNMTTTMDTGTSRPQRCTTTAAARPASA